MNISEKSQNTIHRNRLAIAQQLRDIEDQIAYIRRAFDATTNDYMDEPEVIFGHQASNMMSRVMELSSLIATNSTIIKMANAKVGA